MGGEMLRCALHAAPTEGRGCFADLLTRAYTLHRVWAEG